MDRNYIIAGIIIFIGIIIMFIYKKPKKKKNSDSHPNNQTKWDDNEVHSEGDF